MIPSAADCKVMGDSRWPGTSDIPYPGSSLGTCICEPLRSGLLGYGRFAVAGHQRYTPPRLLPREVYLRAPPPPQRIARL